MWTVKAVPEPAAFSTHQGSFCGLAGRITVIENTDLDLTIQTNVSYLCCQSPVCSLRRRSGVTDSSVWTQLQLGESVTLSNC
ncbi:hypothetical protein EXN66_Car004915 [Channa argus]|uniref:Uncharacterized protein n=1 Tax=Channa argus TaxID=215402 RepID=A0A6G1PGC8_CHAAH|nr:hypothetical protein EXN66_Car004915 [Channa argus]